MSIYISTSSRSHISMTAVPQVHELLAVYSCKLPAQTLEEGMIGLCTKLDPSQQSKWGIFYILIKLQSVQIFYCNPPEYGSERHMKKVNISERVCITCSYKYTAYDLHVLYTLYSIVFNTINTFLIFHQFMYVLYFKWRLHQKRD